MAKTIRFTETDRKKYSVLTNILGLKDIDMVREVEVRPGDSLRLYCASRWDYEEASNPKNIQNILGPFPEN